MRGVAADEAEVSPDSTYAVDPAVDLVVGAARGPRAGEHHVVPGARRSTTKVTCRPDGRRPAPDLLDVEHDVVAVHVLATSRLGAAAARPRTAPGPGTRHVEAAVQLGVAAADGAQPAEVDRERLHRLPRQVEVPLALVVAVQALGVEAVDVARDLAHRLPERPTPRIATVPTRAHPERALHVEPGRVEHQRRPARPAGGASAHSDAISPPVEWAASTTWSWPSRSTIRCQAASMSSKYSREVGRRSSGSGARAATGRTCAGRGRRSRSRGRPTTRRTRSGRSSRRSRARRAPRGPVGCVGAAGAPGCDSTGALVVGGEHDGLDGVRRAEDVGRQVEGHGVIVSRLDPCHAARPRTSASNRPRRAAISGCHCTPRQNAVRRACLHGLERAVLGPGRSRRSPGASRTDWWWWQCASSSGRRARARPASRARCAPSTVPKTSPPGLCCSWPTRSGVCWSRAPPAAPPSAACRGRRRARAGRPPRRRRAGPAPRRPGRVARPRSARAARSR